MSTMSKVGLVVVGAALGVAGTKSIEVGSAEAMNSSPDYPSLVTANINSRTAPLLRGESLNDRLSAGVRSASKELGLESHAAEMAVNSLRTAHLISGEQTALTEMQASYIVGETVASVKTSGTADPGDLAEFMMICSGENCR